MAGVALENWVERIRDPKIECMSRDEMADLQSKRLVDVVKRVYDNVDFYRKKMQQRGVEPGDIKSIEDIEKLPFTTKEDLKNNYPFGLLAIPMKDVDVFRGLPEQQVNSRSLRIHRKMWKCGESVWHAVSHGRTYK